MQRVLSRMKSILPHLFIFSVLSLFAGTIFSGNPFAIILGIAGFYGIMVCAYTVVMQFVMLLTDKNHE